MENAGAAAEDRTGEGLLAMLPDEVINVILEELSPSDIVDGVSEVSPRLTRICTDVALWTKLKVRVDEMKGVWMAKFDLRTAERDFELLSLLETLRTCPKLEQLTVDVDKHSDLAKVFKAIDKLDHPKLQSLTLKREWDLKGLENANFRRITVFELHHDADKQGVVNQEALENIASACPAVKILKLSGTSDIFDLSPLSKCAFLKKLRLAHFSTAALVSLSQLKNLMNLSLWDAETTQEKSEDYVDYFSLARNLKEVWVMRCKIDDLGMRAIVNGCPNLTKLDLIKCEEVTDAGLALVLTECTTLTSLWLSSLPKITAEAFRGMEAPLLRRIHITGVPLRQRREIRKLLLAHVPLYSYDDDTVSSMTFGL